MCGTRQQTAIVVWGHHLQVPTLTQVMLLSEDFWAIFSRIPYPQWLLSLVLSTCPNPNFLPLTPWMHGLLTLLPVHLLPLEFRPESVFTKWAHNRKLINTQTGTLQRHSRQHGDTSYSHQSWSRKEIQLQPFRGTAGLPGQVLECSRNIKILYVRIDLKKSCYLPPTTGLSPPFWKPDMCLPLPCQQVHRAAVTHPCPSVKTLRLRDLCSRRKVQI